jgi:hypothetical protein
VVGPAAAVPTLPVDREWNEDVAAVPFDRLINLTVPRAPKKKGFAVRVNVALRITVYKAVVLRIGKKLVGGAEIQEKGAGPSLCMWLAEGVDNGVDSRLVDEVV